MASKLLSGVKVPDGRTIYVRESDGESSITGTHGDAINNLTVDVIKQSIDKLDNADIVIIQLKMPKESVDFVIQYCQAHNKRLIINPAPADPNKLDISKISSSTYLTPNRDEALALFPGLSIQEIVTQHPNVIITRGRDGVMYYLNGEVKTMAALKEGLENTLDVTGAGDTFTGTFATAISEGMAFEKAIDFARIASGIKVQKKEAQKGIPQRADIEKALEQEQRQWR